MKMFKKFLFILSTIILYANNTFAATNGTYVARNSSEIGKVFFFLVSIALIVLVLFLNYKADEKELSEENKNTKNLESEDKIKEVDAMYSETYNKYKENLKKDYYQNKFLDTNVQKVYVEEKAKNSKNEVNEEQKTELINTIKKDYSEKVEIGKNINYRNDKLDDMTMVFKTGILRNTSNDKKSENNKTEEDIDLEEIEKTIAKAKINTKNKSNKKQKEKSEKEYKKGKKSTKQNV